MSQVLGSEVRISGWAASLRYGRRADAILIFAGERYVGTVSPTNERPDVRRAQDLPEDDYGYVVKFPLRLAQVSGEPPELNVFAAEGAVASQLPFNCSSESDELWCWGS